MVQVPQWMSKATISRFYCIRWFMMDESVWFDFCYSTIPTPSPKVSLARLIIWLMPAVHASALMSLKVGKFAQLLIPGSH